MDQPTLSAVEHGRALRGLGRLNRWSATVGAVWPLIRERCRVVEAERGRPARVLDLASGGGDVAIGLWERARAEGVALEMSGCDRSDFAVEQARGLAERRRATVRFRMHDVIADRLPGGYDILLSTLFLHHLSEAEACLFLGRMAELEGAWLVVDDLIRCRVGWTLAWLGSRFLTRSRVVHIDALRSVEGAFRSTEALDLAERAGWVDPKITTHWPARFALTGRGR